MTVAELISRVTLRCLVTLAALTAGAGWLAGRRGAAGVVAGGAIALLNFRWLARSAVGAWGGGRGTARGLAAVGLRYAAIFGALTLTLAGGWAHPLAVLAGLSVVPPVLIVESVRTAG